MSAKTITKPKKTKTPKAEKKSGGGKKAARAKEKPAPWYRYALRFLLACIPGLIAGGLLWYSTRDKDFSEWFALRIQPLWQGSMGRLTSLFPFSVNEIVIYLAILAAVFFLVRDITRLCRGRQKKLWLYAWLKAAVLAGGILFLMSTVGSGVNFSRYTFAEKSGLSVEGGTVDELEALDVKAVEGILEVGVGLHLLGGASGLGRVASGAVDQDVDPSELFVDEVTGSLEGGLVEGAGADAEALDAELPRDGLSLGGVVGAAADDGEVDAGGGETACQGCAQHAEAAGDDAVASLEIVE